MIWVHSYNVEPYLEEMPELAGVYRAQHFLGDGIGQIAVPGFFMISGYLFYRDFTWEKLGEKWKRRIRSVLVPYALWNFLYYLGYVVGGRLPGVAGVVGRGRIPFHLWAAVDAVIHFTYNPVFWYLYQLILLILLAPVLYPILRRRWSRAVLLVVLWWMVGAGRALPLVNADALIYYSSAASLALAGRRQAERGNGSLWGFVLLAVAIIAYRIGLSRAFIPGFVLCRLLAVAGFWMAVPGDKLPRVRDFMSHNFFLYGIHFIFVRLINKGGTRIFPVGPGILMLLYLLMPLLVLGIATAVGKILRRCLPGVWGLLNGGRT